MKLVIASKNLHKIREIRSILKPLFPFDYFSLLDFPQYKPLEETGSTFEENARMKAIHAAKILQCLVLADDSGLVVPSLDNRPGIYSDRYAGKGATDYDNLIKLIKELEDLDEQTRTGYYACALALANPEGVQKEVAATAEGYLILTPRGNHGFGYDPIFVKFDYNKTFAEMDEETKNRISHRRKALDKLLPFFDEIIKCTIL